MCNCPNFLFCDSELYYRSNTNISDSVLVFHLTGQFSMVNTALAASFKETGLALLK